MLSRLPADLNPHATSLHAPVSVASHTQLAHLRRPHLTSHRRPGRDDTLPNKLHSTVVRRDGKVCAAWHQRLDVRQRLRDGTLLRRGTAPGSGSARGQATAPNTHKALLRDVSVEVVQQPSSAESRSPLGGVAVRSAYAGAVDMQTQFMTSSLRASKPQRQTGPEGAKADYTPRHERPLLP